METYIVQPGDNIADIASRFNVTVGDLVKINNLESIYFLTPGLELIIPNASITPQGIYDYYIVKNGDSLYQIGLKYGVDAMTIAQLNGLNINEYIYPNQQLLVPRRNLSTYITKEGDTINEIASKLGVSKEDIILYNTDLYLMPNQSILYHKRTTEI